MSSGLYSGVSGLALGTGLYRNVSGLWSGASGLIAGFDGGNPYSGASLYLDFLNATSLDSRITFTRGSNATLTDSTGKITYAPANLLTYSEQFDNAAWVKTAVSATANSTTAPDGTNTADTLAADGTASPHNIRQTGVVAGFARIFFTYAKAGTSNFVQLYFDGDAGPFADFDLATGIVGTTGSNQTASITSVGNGWYRCAIYTASTTATTPRIGIISSASAARAESNSLSTSIYVWGAQLEPVTYQTTPSTYQATTSTAYYGPRFDYDPVTLAAKGLLIEEQRANLLVRSEEFDNASWIKTRSSITANATTSPDGTVNADRLVDDTATGTHRAIQTVAKAASAIQYTGSVYLKADSLGFATLRISGTAETTSTSVGINLSTGALSAVATTGFTDVSASAVNAGNGWWRLSITGTSDTTTTIVLLVGVATSLASSSVYTGTGTGSIFVYGAQLEAGAFATSYIPTTASTATRSADVATMTGTNFSAWYNQAQGTFAVSFDTASPSTKWVYNANDGTISSYIGTDISSGGNLRSRVIISNVTQASITSVNVVSTNTTAKGAFAYETNSFQQALDGVLGAQDTSGTVPTIDRLVIGAFITTGQLNGHIRTIAYYNTRLPNAQLQSLTT